MDNKPSPQVLKSRDDYSPVTLVPSGGSTGPPFALAPGTTCSWADTESNIEPSTLRDRIEPWLTALLQSEHLSLLIGSGLTQAVQQLAEVPVSPGMGRARFGVLDAEIRAEAKRVANLAHRQEGNFEDQVRVANELLRGLEILASTNHPAVTDPGLNVGSLRDAIDDVLMTFTTSVLDAERSMLEATPEKRERAFNYLVSFLLTFAGRSGTRDRLHIFTTNYDRFIEAGADIAGLRLLDRFVGTLAPVFRASRLDIDMHYNPPGIRGEPRYLEGVARFTKLHGSVDWLNGDGAIRRVGLGFGAGRGPLQGLLSDATESASNLLIYPNSAKDRETTDYPYVELFRDFASAICRPNSTLVCYGYGFGDDHINRVIADMLTIPSAHLVVISYSDPLGRVQDFYDRLGRHAQFTLLVGDHVADLRVLIQHYLPKPAIDRTSLRMSELLKARWGTESAGEEPQPEGADEVGDER